MICRCAFLFLILLTFGHTGAAGLVISEFLAVNQDGLKDENGDPSDWIEIYNDSAAAVDLGGWHLTDEASRPVKWTFPATSLDAGRFLVVFASGKNRAVSGRELHTNFRLSADGEYLALTRPDQSVASAFEPVFPPQGLDIAYGQSRAESVTEFLVRAGDSARYLAPANDTLGAAWLQPAFDDAHWSAGPTPLGFDTAGSFSTYQELVLADDPILYWNFDEPDGAALNRVNPTAAQDMLVPQGRSGRVAHASLNSGLLLGSAANFPGADDGSRFVAPNLSLGADVAGAWAVEFWARLTNVNKTTYFIEGSQANGGANAPGLIHGFNGPRLEIFGAGGRTGSDGPVFNQSGWHHFLFGYFGSGSGDGVASRHDIYVDGARVSSQTGDFASPLPFGSGGLSVGGTLGTGVHVVAGQMDELAVYDLRHLPDAAGVAANMQFLATNHYRAVWSGDFGLGLGTNVRDVMHNRASSLFARHEFTVTNAAAARRLMLRVKFNDGVAAWLNGVRVLTVNAPENPHFNATALTNRPRQLALEWTSFDLSALAGELVEGTNVLALQGLNASAADPDFLLAAELTSETSRVETGYLLTPTPGAANGAVSGRLGPILREVTENPPRPAAGQSLAITARVDRTLAGIAGVRLLYRVMYGSEVSLPMLDNGVAPDARAGDGLFSAAIPGAVFGAGQMIRWAVLATDSLNTAARAPVFFPTNNSPQYFGTVAIQPGATSNLPVLEWFLAPGTESAARTRIGTRASVFYDGEFYDNIFVHLRGRTAAGLEKNPYQFEFNPGHKFRHSPNQSRVDEFALNTTYRDKAYIRPVLGYELFRDAGAPGSICFPMQVRRNNQFFSLALFVEFPDRDYLERNGLDRNGTLYKADLNGFTVEAQSGYLPVTQGFEKKTPDDTDFSDIIAFARGLALSGEARRRFVFDNVDLPEVVNYMAVSVLLQDADRLVTNFYPYRDTHGSGEWMMLPWDLDLSLGQANNSTDETLTTQDYPGGPCHPFYATQAMPDYRNPALWNKLIDVITGTPVFREMFTRRLRTLMDQFLKPPGTPAEELYFEPRIQFFRTNMAADVVLDKARWATWGQSQTFDQALNLIAAGYLPGRRVHLFTNHSVLQPGYPNNAGIPLAQSPSPQIRFGAIEANPASGNQEEEYFQLLNATAGAVDISGWRVTGGVEHTFRPGTVIPAGGLLHVAKNVRAFRARAASPKGGEGCLAQGNYQGRLSAWGEALELRDAAGRALAATNYPGNPGDVQRWLRVTELMYHPAPAGTNAAEDDEYIELKNTGPVPLDLAGVRVTDGVEFNFSAGAVTNLAPGARVLLVRNLAAFSARYGTNGRLIAGQYAGALDNSGEQLRLLDAAGEEVLDFSYDNRWYPVTDGLGFSLVIVDDQASFDTWGAKASWRPSGSPDGSPGADDPAPPALAPVLINEVLSASNPPDVDAIELFNPNTNAVDIGGWFLTDDLNTPKKYRIPDGTTLEALEYLVFTEAQFNLGGTGFAFGADGDEAYLCSGDAQTNLTGYLHGFVFGAAERQVSYGRYLNSQGEEHFVAQSANSFGQPNASPQVGPVIISEIMYHPPDLGTADNTEGEYVVLYNLGTNPARFFDPAYPTNTWRLREAIDYDFPTNTALEPGSGLVLVSFDPITEPSRAAEFRAAYEIGDNLLLLGPYAGKLDNSRETLDLLQPLAPNGGAVPYALVERVAYRDAAPWPAEADGWGASLHRRAASNYANDPANWTAAAPSPAALELSGDPPAIHVPPAGLSVSGGEDARFTVEATGSAPLRYQWQCNGTNLPGATSAALLITNTRLRHAGSYRVMVFNRAGATTSDEATLEVRIPPQILAQPRGASVDRGGNVVFSVQAEGSGSLWYQWRFNGVDLSGATNATLSVTNVQLTDNGSYAVLVGDDIGSILSQTAFLAVRVPPVVVAQPRGQSVVAGDPVMFRVSVSEDVARPLGFRWRRGVTTLTNIVQPETTCVFYLPAARFADSGNYTVIITNGSGQQTISAPAMLTVLADSDGDLLPDAWEAAYGLNTNNHADAALDSDGDTMSNRAEYLAGTDPTDPASCLKIESFTIADGKGMLGFSIVSNRNLAVDIAGAAAHPVWQELTNVPALPTNFFQWISDPLVSTNRFYRLRIPLASP